MSEYAELLASNTAAVEELRDTKEQLAQAATRDGALKKAVVDLQVGRQRRFEVVWRAVVCLVVAATCGGTAKGRWRCRVHSPDTNMPFASSALDLVAVEQWVSAHLSGNVVAGVIRPAQVAHDEQAARNGDLKARLTEALVSSCLVPIV